MNIATLAQRTYSGPSAQLRSPRDLEFALIANATARLRSALQSDGPKAFPSLAAALDHNRQIWQTLAEDIAQPTNGLPRDLRARLFYLSEFVTGHSDKVLSNGADAGVLVDINIAVMRGLSGDVNP